MEIEQNYKRLESSNYLLVHFTVYYGVRKLLIWLISRQVISNSQMNGTSRAKVYADVNVNNPRDYWDYENHQTEWGWVLTLHYTVLYHTIHYTLFSIHYTIKQSGVNPDYKLYSGQWYTIHYTIYSIYIIHYTIYIIQYTLHYKLYIMYYTLYNIHYTL